MTRRSAKLTDGSKNLKAAVMHPELRAAVNKARGSETAQARSSNSKQLVVYDADTVKPEPVEWLWPGRIAIGQTTLVGGDPGLGKSQLSIFIASTISQTGQWPCGEGTPPKRSVIMLSAEDGSTREGFGADARGARGRCFSNS